MSIYNLLLFPPLALGNYWSNFSLYKFAFLSTWYKPRHRAYCIPCLNSFNWNNIFKLQSSTWIFYFVSFVCLLTIWWVFVQVSIWDILSNNTLSIHTYIHIYLYIIYVSPFLLFLCFYLQYPLCFSHSHWNFSSWQSSSYFHICFVYDLLSLIRVISWAWCGLFTGAWVTYQGLHHWRKWHHFYWVPIDCY